MATNDFLPFAAAGGANVLAQPDWLALAARLSGYTAGVASSQQINKGLRQSAAIAAMVGQFINDYGGLDALDDGNITNLVRDFARSLQAGKFSFVVATGTASAWVVTPTPSIAIYVPGMFLRVTVPATNASGAVTANVSGLGAKPIKKRGGADPAEGDLVAGDIHELIYDGANFVVMTTLASDFVQRGNILINGDFQINQRAFAGGALANGVYGFDRWKASGATSLTLAGYVLTLASGEIAQVIEPALWGVTSLASTAITVSVEAPTQDLTVTVGSVTGTITAGSGRRSVTLTTGAGDTGNLTVKLKRSAAGSVSFGRVKAEIGTTASTWRPRSAAEETGLAYRYYWKFTAPYAEARIAMGYVNDTGNFTINMEMPAEMRVTPTVTIGGSGWYRKVTSLNAVTAITSVALHRHVLALQFESAALTPGTVYPAALVSQAAGSTLTLDAEL